MWVGRVNLWVRAFLALKAPKILLLLGSGEEGVCVEEVRSSC
jgi:hypothetical protein